MLLEASGDTAARQGDGLTEYDGAVQPAAVGMEVERSTDETGGADRDAAGTTAVGSTEVTATNAGAARMEVEGVAEGAPGGGGGRGLATEAGTTAMQAAGARRHRAGASEGLTRGERRKLAKAKKRAVRL